VSDRTRINVFGTVPAKKLEEFKSLRKEMVARATAEDSGTLSYEWFFEGEEETEFRILAVFESSDAMLTYLKRAEASGHGKRFLEACEMTKGEVFGNLSDALRDEFEPWRDVIHYYRPADGFTR